MSTWPDWIVVAIVVAVSLLASAGLGSPIASLVLRSARVPEPPTVEISGDARQPVMRRRDDPAPQVREVLRGGASRAGERRR